MRDPLRTNIGQFSSVAGQLQGRAANVRAIEPAPDLPGAQRGKLYMLAEVTGSGGGHPAMYRRILDSAQRAFYETEGSVETALQRAIRSAHSELHKINEALPEASWRAGMSCVALQGTTLTIAQANPALVVVSHPKTVDLIPPDVHPRDGMLGGSERPEIQVVEAEAEPGSMIVLAESRWLEAVRPEVLAAAATADTPSQVADYLRQLAGQGELSALIIGLESAVPEVQEHVPAPLIQAPAVAVSPAVETVEPGEASPEAPAPERGRGLFGRLARPAQPVPAEPEVAAPASPSEPAPEPIADFAVATTAEPYAPRAEAAVEETRRSPWALILALVIIPLLIAVVVISIFVLRNRSQENEFQSVLDGASAAIASTEGLPDDSAGQRLAAAKDFLDKARAIKPNDSRLEPVQAKYEENLNRVNHVSPLYGVVPLWTFNGEGQKLARVLVANNSVFVLDLGPGEVNRFTLAGLGDTVKPNNPQAVLAKGQQVKGSDQVVADLVDMTWVEAVSNQTSRLLVLDNGGALYGYDTVFGPTRLTIGGRDQWGAPKLIAGYGGNLYIVDAKANQIWRYRPAEQGYGNQPERYFGDSTRVDLGGVQSIAIDGNIWLLFADGRLLKFLKGEQQPFELKGMPNALSNPVAVVASAEGDQIYVADAGNDRIVEINKSGQFQRQFRPAQGGSMLRDARSLYLDETGGVLYILTDKTLYKANLPRVAPAATPAATTTPASTPQK